MSRIYLLNNLEFDGVTNLEVFEIENIVSTIDISKFDALIFTSKNAIHSLNSFNTKWKDIPSYAIAPKTAEIINSYNANLVFTGLYSHGNEFANELIPLLKNKKVLYVKGEKSVSNLTNILKENNISIEELVTYKTSCKKSNEPLEKNSIFIFSSPSSIKCFFNNYSWDNTYKAIAIGHTTAKYLPSNISYQISSTTSIIECIKLAKQIIN